MASPDLEKLLSRQDEDGSSRDASTRFVVKRRILFFLTGLALALLFLSRAKEHVSCWRQSSLHHGSSDGQTIDQTAVLHDVEDVIEPSPLAHRQAMADKNPAAKRAGTSSSAAAATPTVLECFQVAEPVLMPYGASYESSADDGSSVSTQITNSPTQPSCTVLLMEHDFGWSYGIPFVGNYTPPSCQFNRVVMNFTVVSEGRQYDRLALMYLGDNEVWRTSTAEPTKPPGIRWEYLKDMTEYLSLWKTDQTIIFDLGNLITDVYTGYYNTTLTATFFMSDVDTGTAPPSDLIIPISQRIGASGEASAFTLPAENATNTVSFPRNANRAVFSVSACGQGNEEFWWSNVLLSDQYAFNPSVGWLPTYSPFREVQVLIDGQIVGVQWPFPVIFTGGVVPGLHRPIVGIDVFDLREHQIDITPWLPLLCDGKEHTFTIQVAGLTDNGGTRAEIIQPIEGNWVVTGKIFVWLDDEDSITTGSAPVVEEPPPYVTVSQSITQDASGANETLAYTAVVKRSLSVSAEVKSQKSSGKVSWAQELAYSNKGLVYGYGWNELSDFSLTGTDSLTGPVTYATSYSYPLWCNTTFAVSAQGNISIWAHLSQGLDLRVVGASVFPTGLEAFEGGVPRTRGQSYPGGSLLATTVTGTAWFYETGDKLNSSSWGSTNQVFRFGAMDSPAEGFPIAPTMPDVELYYRDVTAVNGSVISDQERVAGAGTANVDVPPPPPGQWGGAKGMFAQLPEGSGTGPRAFAGRDGGP